MRSSGDVTRYLRDRWGMDMGPSTVQWWLKNGHIHCTKVIIPYKSRRYEYHTTAEYIDQAVREGKIPPEHTSTKEKRRDRIAVQLQKEFGLERI